MANPFSSGLKKFSGAVYSPFITNKYFLPATVPSTVVSSILQNQMPIFVNNVVTNILESGYTKIRAYHKQAKTAKNPFGQSSISASVTTIHDDVIEAWLVSQYGEIEQEYALNKEFNYYHFAYTKLTDEFGSISPNNTVLDGTQTKYIGTISVYVLASEVDESTLDDPDYTSDMEPVYFDYLDTPFFERASAFGYVIEKPPLGFDATSKVEIELYWEEYDSEEDTDVVRTETKTYFVSSDTPETLYLLKYTQNSEIYYRSVADIEGATSSTSLVFNEAMDIIENLPLMNDGYAYWVEDNYPQYVDYYSKSSRKLNIELGDITDSLETNEDFDKFQDSTIMFAFSLNTKLQVGKDYIFQFFHWLNNNLQLPLNSPVRFTSTTPVNTHTISFLLNDIVDTVGEYDFKRAEAEITQEGLVTIAKGNIFNPIDPIIVLAEEFYSDSYVMPEGYKKFRNDGYSVAISMPISDTVKRTYLLRELGMEYSTPIKHAYVSLGAMSASDMALVIPVSMNLVMSKAFNFTQREQILAGSMGLLITWSYKTRTKMWQRVLSVVLIIIAIVGIVLTFFTGPIGAAIAGGASAASVALLVIIQVLIMIILPLVMKQIIKVLVKIFGAEVTAILAAIIAIVVMIYAPQSGGSMLSSTLLQAGSLAAPTMAEYLEKETKALMEEANYNAEQYKQELEELEDKLNELKGRSWVNPFEVWERNSKLMHPTESVTSFIDRLIHTGNIGVLALSYPAQYVDISLSKNAPRLV